MLNLKNKAVSELEGFKLGYLILNHRTSKVTSTNMIEHINQSRWSIVLSGITFLFQGSATEAILVKIVF
jgi:hypothetical protein